MSRKHRVVYKVGEPVAFVLPHYKHALGPYANVRSETDAVHLSIDPDWKLAADYQLGEDHE